MIEIRRLVYNANLTKAANHRNMGLINRSQVSEISGDYFLNNPVER